MKNLLIFTAVILVLICPAVSQTCSKYQFYNGSACQFCDSTCDTCTSKIACTTCTPGYQIMGRSCGFTCSSPKNYIDFNYQTCNSCSRSCSYCIEAANNCNNCTSDQFYLPHNGTCGPYCPSNVGYYESTAERRCIPCRDLNCLRCDSMGNCINCKSFWNLDSSTGRCTRGCPLGCSACTANGNCLACESGWTYSSNNNSCTCPKEGCRGCGQDKCFDCQEGNWLELATGSCSCTVNCRICDSSTTCIFCEPGFYNSGGNCNRCPQGCRYCTGGSRCTACENGYHMSTAGGTCYKNTASPSTSGSVLGYIIGGILLIIIIIVFYVLVNRRRKLAASDTATPNYVAHIQQDGGYVPPSNIYNSVN